MMTLQISTHTPRAGRDIKIITTDAGTVNFYSHAPCGARLPVAVWFLLTTWISTHTPRAGRDERFLKEMGILANFYSHAPCGARLSHSPDEISFQRFLLTRPVRGATVSPAKKNGLIVISTHTPRAGRDKIV